MAAAQVRTLTYAKIARNPPPRIRVRASLACVAEFHSRAASMPAITPPPIIVQVHHDPPVLTGGDAVDLTMWF